MEPVRLKPFVLIIFLQSQQQPLFWNSWKFTQYLGFLEVHNFVYSHREKGIFDVYFFGFPFGIRKRGLHLCEKNTLCSSPSKITKKMGFLFSRNKIQKVFEICVSEVFVTSVISFFFWYHRQNTTKLF